MRRTLFLHVGLPRCASSALQDWAGMNRALLGRAGILWPQTDDLGLEVARHQWLPQMLKTESDGRLEALLASASDDVLMSCEGLSLQFDQFPAENLAWFRQATADWDVRLVLMTRNTIDWQRSMWKQCMVNPISTGSDFGLPVDMADFGGLPRVQRMTDVRRLARDLQAGFGANDVVQISSDGAWLTELGQVLDVDLTDATMPERRHESLPDAVIEIVRAINAEGLAGGPREALLALLQLALDTRSDTLRELLRQKRDDLPTQHAALADALPRVIRGSGSSPATQIALEAMTETLAELQPVAGIETP